MYSELAGKITGMLLEIDNSDLLHMLEHQESLKSKVSIRTEVSYVIQISCICFCTRVYARVRSLYVNKILGSAF